MPYVKTINEDGVVSDIMAKALDPDVLVNDFTQATAGEKALDAAAGKTLNDAVVKKADLVNGFTQTTPGVNALDAAAGKSLNDSLANLSTDVSTNYATKTDLSNGYVPQTNSITIPSWKGIFNFYSGNAITMIIPVTSLKNGTLSSSSNISWNLFGITYTNPAGVSIVSNVSLTISSVERITRDLAVVTFNKPSTMTTDMYGVAVNRGQFKISST